MVRKQLYITETQNDVLKRRAKESGVSEAELVRHALDYFFTEESPAGSRHQQALNELMETLRRDAREHPLKEGYQFNREELYNDRPKNWADKSN